MGNTSSFPLQVLVQRDLPPVDVKGRELVGKGSQCGVDSLPPQASPEPAEGLLHDLRVLLLAIQADDNVRNLVDQAHGVDLPGLDGLFREADQIPGVVHLLGKHPGRVKVGKDDVAAEGKQRVLELVAIARLARDVEFHLYCAAFLHKALRLGPTYWERGCQA